MEIWQEENGMKCLFLHKKWVHEKMANNFKKLIKAEAFG